MSVTVRFAPSPTGFLHIGGARTALFNYLFARHHGGKFLLRIEDTDRARSTQQAIQAILDGLHWLGLQYDGDAVLQTANQARHQQVANQLLASGNAYFCYTDSEELEYLRKQAESQGKVFRFESPWRDKVQSQQSAVKPVIRLKANKQGSTTISDLVQGTVTVANSELDDMVLLRSDGTPTYMFAVVVDDHDMQISHIIRGNDHFTNSFRQKIIYQSLDWQVPHFAHIPLIHGCDGSKMSKRHGATSVIDYKNMGYLPEAMRNYLLRLGWSHNNDEIISDQQAIAWFGLENIGKSPSRFDFDKLNHLNQHYLRQDCNLFAKLQPFLHKQPQNQDADRIKQALNVVKEKSVLLTDLAKIVEVYYADYRGHISDSDSLLLNKDIIVAIRQNLAKIEVWQLDNIRQVINDFCQQNKLKLKDCGIPLRIALTYSSVSAGGIFDIINILGKDLVLTRLQQC
jgi:glutamyl-tRNA synthetase